MAHLNLLAILTIIIQLTSIVRGSSLGLTIASESLREECTLDADGTNSHLDHCIELAQTFAEDYDKALRKDKDFARCEAFERFDTCLSTLLNSCPSISNVLKHKPWWHVYQSMSCVCQHQTEDLRDGTCAVEVGDMECMETQHSSIYMMLCQDLYAFNINQKTHKKCRFFKEKLDCETSLVASACGEPVAAFYTALAKLSTKKDHCFVPSHAPEHKTQSFRYTEHCPTNITTQIQKCTKKHEVKDILHFHDDNLLVAKGNKKQLKNSCGSYVKYQECFDGIRETCPDGLQRLLDYNGDMRSYMLKMDFICNGHKRSYLDSMYCYQQMVANESFATCEWSDVTDKLSLVTSYQYYCHPQSQEAQELNAALNKIEQCYVSVITNGCGNVAAKTMSDLIKIAFQDPYYLQFDFKPDCKLHSKGDWTGDTTTQPTTTMKTTTTTKRTITKLFTAKPSPSIKRTRRPVVQRSIENNASAKIFSVSISNVMLPLLTVVLSSGHLLKRIIL